MSTVVVWVLVLHFSGGPYTSQSAVVIDNIASEQNCKGLYRSIASQNASRTYSWTVYGYCAPVRKAAP